MKEVTLWMVSMRCLPTMNVIVITTSEVKDIENKIRYRRLTQVSPEKECGRIEIVEDELLGLMSVRRQSTSCES